MAYVGRYFESRLNETKGEEERIHYIRAGEESLALHKITVKADSSVEAKTLWQSLDHIGSTVLTTDETGHVSERMSYDPHGKRRADDWQPDLLGSIRKFDTPRGFTGHEMLDNVGIIHMNGRVYDPTIGRMLSSDPTIPEPLVTQSFNRYAYVHNNPLSYTDPTGFRIGANSRGDGFNAGEEPGSYGGARNSRNDTPKKDKYERMIEVRKNLPANVNYNYSYNWNFELQGIIVGDDLIDPDGNIFGSNGDRKGNVYGGESDGRVISDIQPTDNLYAPYTQIAESGLGFFDKIFDRVGNALLARLIAKGAKSYHHRKFLEENLRVQDPRKVDEALRHYENYKINIGVGTVQFQKADMKHVLTRHHVDFWDGSPPNGMKQPQTFFREFVKTPEQVALIATHVSMQNKQAFSGKGKRTVYGGGATIKGSYFGRDYSVSFYRGKITNVTPLPY